MEASGEVRRVEGLTSVFVASIERVDETVLVSTRAA